MFAAVIPTYQREATVVRAVESVLAQTLAPSEVIVVDDGSTDASVERLRAFGEAVKVVSQTQSGSAVARNVGVTTARAEWIAFLDSDDQWEPDHLERISDAILSTAGRADLYFRDTEVAMATFDHGTPEIQAGSYWAMVDFAAEDVTLVEDGSAWILAATQPMIVSSSVVRRARYIALGGMWPELRLRHDTYLYLRLGFGRPICAVPGVGAKLTDDAPETRLTRGVTPLARPYWDETALMYEDLARRCGSASQRREFKDRLATAHWRTARIESVDRNLRGTMLALFATFRTKPSYLPRRVLVQLGDRLRRSERVRPT